MGPLVPDIIGNELNFVVALLIGIAFGAILDQAGFSTSKKLVGLFYGYDFTVLRVFFTAGVTAMLGVVALGHFGLLDLSIIYINPTFLWSALIGGVIMGLGFVVGGFCPGTSICAAAIGKIDAMIFIVGSLLGVLIFAEGYPLFENIYKVEFWGYPRLFETLGMSQGLFAFLLTAVAVGAFWITTLIENKVNGKPNPEFRPAKLYVALTGIAAIFAFSAFFMPDLKEEYLKQVEDVSYVNSYNLKEMTSDELSFRILDDDKNLLIIDLRSVDEYKEFSLPKSQLISMKDLFGKDAAKMLEVKSRKNVFLADDELTERKAAIIADKLGYDEVSVLKGGLITFKEEILNFTMPDKVTSRWQEDDYRFRLKASKLLPQLIEENKHKAIPKKTSKRVLGGC